jgi:hypothetical protein
LRTLVIGRSPFADVVLADDSIAPHHAEIVVTATGRYHLTDCASPTGTWRSVPSADGGDRWQPVRQAFVRGDEPLRLGDYVCTAEALVRAAGFGNRRPAGVSGEAGAVASGRRPPLHGRLERDPATGEIVRRRP